jgi:hypothetical protein
LGVVSAAALLSALIAAVRLASVTGGGCEGAETRVRGIDLAVPVGIRGVEVVNPTA